MRTVAQNHFETNVQQAVETWTETTREAYQVIANSVVATQERNIKLAQTIFESAVAELKTQADTSRKVFEKLTAQSEKQQEAVRTLAQESLNGYSEFLSSPFTYYQKWVEAALDATRR